VMRERVFEPIRMYDTRLRRWNAPFVPNSASSHVLRKGSYERTEFLGGIDISGAGGMTSTIDDMLRWMAHMDAPVVGNAQTWRLMKTPQMLPSGISTGYGCGLQTSPYRGIETLQHGGGALGSNVQMLKVPAAGLDIMVMVNRTDAWSFTYVDRILDACLTGLEATREGHRGPLLSGVFRSPRTGCVVHLYPQETCQMAAIYGHPYPFEPDASGVLRAAGYGASVKFALRLGGAGCRTTRRAGRRCRARGSLSIGLHWHGSGDLRRPNERNRAIWRSHSSSRVSCRRHLANSSRG
jgi:D-aminopeptidase